MKKKIITSLYVIGGCVLLYIAICIADVMLHNVSDYKYADWNVINTCFAEEEISTEVEIVTTEKITTESKFINPDITDTVSIEVGENLTTESVIETVSYAERTVSYEVSDIEILAHLINGEAGADWCSDTTRYYVGSVVLNRVNSNEFPDSIYGVVFQSGQYALTKKSA